MLKQRVITAIILLLILLPALFLPVRKAVLCCRAGADFRSGMGVGALERLRPNGSVSDRRRVLCTLCRSVVVGHAAPAVSFPGGMDFFGRVLGTGRCVGIAQRGSRVVQNTAAGSLGRWAGDFVGGLACGSPGQSRRHQFSAVNPAAGVGC